MTHRANNREGLAQVHVHVHVHVSNCFTW